MRKTVTTAALAVLLLATAGCTAPAATSEGKVDGAMGRARFDSNGIPKSYTVAKGDVSGAVLRRFGISPAQLAEANMVPDLTTVGADYFMVVGKTIQLQKKAVDSRSGTGAVVLDSFGTPDFYTTMAGDSLDSLGYKFRHNTARLLSYNPGLTAGAAIPAGTKVTLMPGALKLPGAQGTFTADAQGLPLTYTTVSGDRETQVAVRFNLSLADMASANRPVTPGTPEWLTFEDTPTTELAPGQTISLSKDHPINK